LVETPAVFPLHRIVTDAAGKLVCECWRGADCPDIGKHPAISWKALQPGEQVRGSEGCGYGIATGSRSGLFVVDVDDLPSWQAFVGSRELPATYVVKTPRGGQHYYFLTPDWPVANSQGVLAPGVDVRGEGGYVVAAGSPHKNGGSYTIECAFPIAPAPDWLLSDPRLKKKEAKVNAEGVALGSLELPANWEALAETVASGWPAKGRHLAQLALAGALLNDGFSANAAFTFLCRVCALAGNEQPEKRAATVQDTSRRIASGIEVTGWPTLERILGPGTAQIHQALLGGYAGPDFTAATPAEPLPFVPSMRRKHDPNHVYSVQVGDVPCGSKTKTSLANITSILFTDPRWYGVLQYDDFTGKVFAVDPPIQLDCEKGGFSDADAHRIALWFEIAHQFLVSPDSISGIADMVAKRNSYHAVQEYLNALPKVQANPATLLDAAKRIFGAETSSWECEFFRRFLIGAAKRAYEPGCKHDWALVLTGQTFTGKSTFVQALFSGAWVGEDLPDLGSKDALSYLAGLWCVELAELDKTLRTSQETVKAFMSKRVDKYRPAYARVELERPRCAVFIGTTNRDDFLRDATGDRRWMPLQVRGQIDTAWTAANRDSLWAAAVAEYRAGASNMFSWEEEKQLVEAREQYKSVDPWLTAVEESLHGKTQVRNEDVYIKVICGGDRTALRNLTRQEQERIWSCLTALGCVRKRAANGRYWQVPDRLAELPSKLAAVIALPSAPGK